MPSISRPGCIEATRTRVGLTCVIGSLLLVALVITGWRLASAGETGQIHTVAMEGMKFSPSAVRIRPGDRLVFENHDLVPHTATDQETGGFDSGLVKPGESWTFVPQGAKAMHYSCTFHPMMQGDIMYEADTTVNGFSPNVSPGQKIAPLLRTRERSPKMVVGGG